MSDNNKSLYYLEELPDYKVASDYYDVRGWDVIDAENRTVGKVTNLLINKQAERVVYLDVEVNKSLIEVGYNTYQVPASDGVHGFINKDGDEHLIVPIGMVSLNKEQKKVLTNQIDYNTFAKAKRFKSRAAIDREYELTLLRYFLRDDTIDISIMDKEFYKRKEFDNSLHRNDD
ncbi:MAG: PRC-barrel domain-containing protein [Bacteroidales bacterium]|nr:PRC-barrel domain-containing protein [Bacteroidales bacterium]